MQSDRCEYCKAEIGDSIYSIPINKECTRWSGSFCSSKCRLVGNRYLEQIPYRTVLNYEEREQWIKMLDTKVKLVNKKKVKL